MSSVSAHAEVRPNNLEFCRRTQNLSSSSNLHIWWVYLEFSDGNVNKGVGNFRSQDISLYWSFCCRFSKNLVKTGELSREFLIVLMHYFITSGYILGANEEIMKLWNSMGVFQ